MPTLQLDAGAVEYGDTQGSGPVVVLVHGLVMDGGVWDGVVERLAGTHRCITPTLPLGGHRRPMADDARLGLVGMAALLAELIERLDLSDVVLVANDWSGPIVTAVEHPERIAALGLVAVEAFDNIPPGLPGRVAAMSARMPGGLALAARALRVRGLRRLPLTFGWMAAEPIDDDLVRGWTEGLIDQPGVRRDVRRYVADAEPAVLADACARLARFDKPASIVWSREDRVMPPAHAEQLAATLPRAELVWTSGGAVLLPLDRPAEVADAIRRLVVAADLP